MDDETRKMLKEHAENEALILIFQSELPPDDIDGVILTLDLPSISFLISRLNDGVDFWEKIDEGNRVLWETGVDDLVKEHENNLARVKKYNELANKLKERYHSEKKEITVTFLDFYILCGLLRSPIPNSKKEERKASFKGVPESILIDVFADICKKMYGVDRYSRSEFRNWLAKKAYDRFGDGGKKILLEAFGDK